MDERRSDEHSADGGHLIMRSASIKICACADKRHGYVKILNVPRKEGANKMQKEEGQGSQIAQLGSVLTERLEKPDPNQ